MDSVKLYSKYSIEELQAMEKRIKDDPKNKITGQCKRFRLYRKIKGENFPHYIKRAIIINTYQG